MKGTEVKNQQTLNDIKTRELLSMLRKIALPIALQSLIGSSLSLIDNLMVGSLGELQLNAVGVSVQIFFVYWMLLYGISGGAATFISQFYGVGDFKNIRRTTGFTLTIAMGIGLLFFIAAEAFPQYILRIFTKFPEVIEEGCSYVRIGAPTFLMLAALYYCAAGDSADQAASLCQCSSSGDQHRLELSSDLWQAGASGSWHRRCGAGNVYRKAAGDGTDPLRGVRQKE